MPRVPSFLRRQRISRTHRGLFCRLFLYRKGSAVKPSPCVATHIGRPAMRRPRPNLHPQAARLLGIRLMYAPPYRHVPHVPARPLVIRSSLRFPGAMRYCADMRRNLRRRIIMDIAQLLSGLALIPPVLISCRQAHRRSPLVPDLDHTSVLHHLRSDIYETPFAPSTWDSPTGG